MIDLTKFKQHQDVWATEPAKDWLGDTEIVGRPNRGLEDLLPTIGVEMDAVKTVVEIGAELGGSTRKFLDLFPNTVVVSVDPWLEGYVLPSEWQHLNPLARQSKNSLLPLFLAFNSGQKERLLPVRDFSSAGLVKVHDMGFAPDLAYVDGDHTYHGVFTDLALLNAFFPNIPITGDDWNFSSSYPRYRGIDYSVQKAVTDFCLHTDREVKVMDNNFAILPVEEGTKVWA